MYANLSKFDLVDLVASCKPYKKKHIKELTKLRLGRYATRMIDSWTWDRIELEQLSEERLYLMYRELK